MLAVYGAPQKSDERAVPVRDRKRGRSLPADDVHARPRMGAAAVPCPARLPVNTLSGRCRVSAATVRYDISIFAVQVPSFRYPWYNSRMNKVMTLNLEQGMPTVADAIRRMESELTALKRRGCRAVILIHGSARGTEAASRCAAGSRADLRGIVTHQRRRRGMGDPEGRANFRLRRAVGAPQADRGQRGVTVASSVSGASTAAG